MPVVRAAASGPAAVVGLRTAHYVHPGGLVASREPAAITTILGSCVSVCLWDCRLGQGGLNHYLLPHWAGPHVASPQRFGNVALEELVDALLDLGSRRADLLARVYGGACVLEAFRARGEHLGAANVALARRFLRQASIAIVDEDVGGWRGRHLTFQTDDGSARVRIL